MKLTAFFSKYAPMLFLSALYVVLTIIYYFWRGQYNAMADDQADFHRIALNVLSGKGFDEKGFRCFLQPAYLATIYALFGVSSKAVFAVNTLLGIVSLWLVNELGHRIFVSRQVGYMSAFLLCCNLPSIAANTTLFSEVTFVFTLLVAVWAIMRHYFSPQSWQYLVLSAFSLGLATLCREWIQYILVFAIPLTAWQYKSQWHSYTVRMVLFLLIWSATLLPWIWRNYQLYDRFLVGTTRTGLLLYSAANPINGNIYGINVTDSLTQYADTHFSNPVEGSDFLVQKTKEQLLANPKRIPYLLALKTLYFFLFIDYELTQQRTINLSYLLWFPFFIYGLWQLFRQRNHIQHWLLVALLIGIFFLNYAICLITYGSPRFRYSTEIYAIMVAAFGVYYAYRRYFIGARE
jgi:4-amino-4-deoxy-L-arabinose transferase-like glycosyltransferase